MKILCRLRGHDWRVRALHVGQLIGFEDVDMSVTHRCRRCRAERTESALGCTVRIDVTTGRWKEQTK